MWKLKTVDELVERYPRCGDPFGWEKGVIARYLPPDAAAALGATPDPEVVKPLTLANVVADTLAYLEYAYREALRHRYVEAQRSPFVLDYRCRLLGAEPLRFAEHPDESLFRVETLREVGRFLGRNDPPTHVREYENTDRIPLDDADQMRLRRMLHGNACTPTCPECRRVLAERAAR